MMRYQRIPHHIQGGSMDKVRSIVTRSQTEVNSPFEARTTRVPEGRG